MREGLPEDTSFPVKDIYHPVITPADDNLCIFPERDLLWEAPCRTSCWICTDVASGIQFPEVKAIVGIVHGEDVTPRVDRHRSPVLFLWSGCGGGSLEKVRT